MVHVNIEECEAAGLDHKEIERIARGLSRYGKQAEALGVTIFGGPGAGSLRFRDESDPGHALIVADIDGDFDGGDGGQTPHSIDGLLRGE